MTGENDEQKKGEGKGFAGLSSLVSDVDTTPPPPTPKKEPAAPGPSAGRPATQATQPKPEPRQTYQPPTQPSSGSSGGKWLLGIAAVIGVLWLIGQFTKNTTAPTSAYSPPAQTATPSYSPPPAEPEAPSRPQESMPPVGQDLVFSMAQIRYCLAEDIRIEGAKSALNNYSDYDVNRFNAMVADYNSRCGSFRYRSGALESARRDVEPYRSQLKIDGQQRITSDRPQGTSSTATQVDTDAPQASGPELTYPAGQQSNPYPANQDSVSISPDTNYSPESGTRTSADMSAEERSSIELACIIAKSNGPAAYNRCVSSQIQELTVGPRAPSLAALNYDEKSAIQLACITSKSQGAASYNRCLVGQMQELESAPRQPSLAGLSYDEKSAIQLACITNKSQGAASYNRCLVSQMQELESAPRQPSLAGLSYDEKSAIQLACITIKSNGPADYNRCLIAQLGELQNAPRTPDLSGLTYQERSSIQLACITEKSSGAAAYNRCLTVQLSSIGR